MAGPGQPGLWRSGVHTLATSVLSVVIGLTTSVLIARSLGPAAKGGYDLTLASGGLAALALGLSLPFGTTYAVARRLSQPGALIRWLGSYAIVQGLVAGLLVVGTWQMALGGTFVPRDLGLMIAPPIAAYVALTSGAAYLRAVLMGQQRTITANNGDLVGRLATPVAMGLALVLTLASGGRPDAVVFLWCVIGGLSVTVAYYGRVLWPELRTGAGPSGLRTVLSFSLPAYLGNLVQFLNYRLDFFLVSSLLGIRAVGLYALAVSLAQLIWLVPRAAAAVLLPRVAAATETRSDNALLAAQIARLSLAVSVAVGIALAATGGLLVPLMYGTAFRDSVEPLLLLLPGIVGLSNASVLGAFIAGVGRPQINLLISAVGLIGTIVLDLALIPSIGIRGAALASSASYLLSTVLTMVIFVRMTSLPLATLLFPTRADAMLTRRLVTGIARSIRKH